MPDAVTRIIPNNTASFHPTGSEVSPCKIQSGLSHRISFGDAALAKRE
ncbi:predicted protein [Sclerotinia sclerotiorum 1980 UF-70]|uniref:Uncharacterized protein n=1 Tax=Sclerotinia sclerotiorum (strain ATCC 18683 / 1980 / Ss-1) TaxID=665079 RepID=A7F358_SCLS1|nr:predicted protein [Sclerotinia sclerotiorum 1980 UF-70]EDN96150.1 predicted protein [Sclerotinia sclerotiorum 1980 UF-70]